MASRNLWTEDQDQLVMKIILKNLEEGNTLVHAYKQAAHQLGRSQGAIKFRWNTLLKKRYKEWISLKKRQSKESNSFPFKTQSQLKLSDIIDYLAQLQEYALYLQNENQRLKRIAQKQEKQLRHVRQTLSYINEIL